MDNTINKYVKIIGKSVLITGLVATSYYVGLRQNPSFQELPERAQHAIVEQHRDADTLLTQAVNEYKRGNPQKAFDLYWQCKKEEAPLEKIDPQHEELEKRLFRYSAAIIDTAEIVKEINSLYKNIVAGTPERIAEYVTSSGLSGFDSKLDTINERSGAYARLDGDAEAQKVLLRYFANNYLRWYDAQKQMREKLQNTEHKTGVMKRALRSLDEKR